MNCEQVELLLEAYALGALDAPTQARVDAHLLECDSCRREAHKFSIVAHTLPEALAHTSPLIAPPSLKASIMAAAANEVQGHAEKTKIEPQAIASAAPARRGGFLRQPRVWRLGLALSALLIIALVVWGAETNLRLQE